MKYRSFLIKYAEIGVKGKNRYLFEDALVKQIHHRLKNLEGNFSVTKEAGRIYAEAAEDFDYDEVIDALQHVFGIVGICPMVQIEDNGYEDLKAQNGVCLPWLASSEAVTVQRADGSKTQMSAASPMSIRPHGSLSMCAGSAVILAMA